MTVDLDALEALASETAAVINGFDVLALIAELRRERKLADADVQRLAETFNENLALKAELRQERKRADDNAQRVVLTTDALWAAEADLSRAEDTIESTLAWLRDDRFTIEGRVRQAEDDLATYLTEYDKQKGQS